MRINHNEQCLTRRSRRAKLRIATLILSILWLVAGCSDSTTPQSQINNTKDVLARRMLPSLRMSWGFTARSVISCPAGECIVLHHPPKFVRTKGFIDGQLIDDYEREMNILLIGDPDTSDDDGEILSDKPDEWSTADAIGGMMVTHNCCTYAIGDVVGLSESDWIAPNAFDATDHTVPMQILLDSYFELIHSAAMTEIEWQRLDRDASFEEGDIFCLVFTKGGQQQFTHVGKIQPERGRNWFIGKFGQGPVIRSTLSAVAEAYRGRFEGICVYRRLKQGA